MLHRLPAHLRRDFSETVRRGRRAGARHLVVHLDAGTGSDPGRPSRAGLVVARSVGSSVSRNRVKRRLRHLLPDRLDALPPASRLVVRALPGCGRHLRGARPRPRGAVACASGCTWRARRSRS